LAVWKKIVQRVSAKYDPAVALEMLVDCIELELEIGVGTPSLRDRLIEAVPGLRLTGALGEANMALLEEVIQRLSAIEKLLAMPRMPPPDAGAGEM
jgi:hypothetical protein